MRIKRTLSEDPELGLGRKSLKEEEGEAKLRDGMVFRGFLMGKEIGEKGKEREKE